MLKIISAVVVCFCLLGSSYSLAENNYRPKSSQIYIMGPKGGCYYINKNGKKTYVDRSLCSGK